MKKTIILDRPLIVTHGVFDIIRAKGYTEFASPYFCIKDLPDDTYPQLNGEYASHVARWIDWWIDNYYQR